MDRAAWNKLDDDDDDDCFTNFASVRLSARLLVADIVSKRMHLSSHFFTAW